MFKDNSAKSYRKTRSELIKTGPKNNLFLIFGPLKYKKKISKLFSSKIKWLPFPEKMKCFYFFVFFCKIGLISNHL